MLLTEEASQLGPVPVDQRREPLTSQTNSNPRPSPVKLLRRKASFIGRVDSSEELPSSHESIFAAEYWSSNSSEDSSHRIESRPLVGSDPTEGPTIPSLVGEVDAPHSAPPSIGSTLIKYGHGTPLTTIVEQRSLATLRTMDSLTPQKSVSELPAAPVASSHLLGHRDSFELPSAVTLRVPRRRKSFSADDLILIKHSYHEACSMIELATRCLRPINKVYAEPRTPIIPPLERPATPPGMPSWTATQNAPIQIPRQQQASSVQRSNRVQRFLGRQLSFVDSSSRVSVPSSLQVSAQSTQSRNARSATSPLPTSIVAPRFRPLRSGHGTGPLALHPFLMSEPSNMKGSSSQTQSGSPRFMPPNRRTPSSIPSGNAKGKIKQGQRPRFTRPRVDRPMGCGSNIDDTEAGVLENGPKQCHHRRRRITGFWSLSNNTGGISVPQINSSATSYGVVSLGTVDSNPACQQIQLTPILEVQFENDTATSSHSQRLGTVTDYTNNRYRPAHELIPRSKPLTPKCWKCRIGTMFQRIDHYVEDITRCCCWICCGVDMDDDDESVLCGSSQEAMMSVPRRVTLDSTPIVVF